eukprot:1134510-Pelagomonas_calceolata.AAC.1
MLVDGPSPPPPPPTSIPLPERVPDIPEHCGQLGELCFGHPARTLGCGAASSGTAQASSN